MTVVIQRVHTETQCLDVRAMVEAHVRFERSDVAIPDDWAARTARSIGSGRLKMLVAVADGATVGYASISREHSTWTAAPFAHLDCLFVDADHRGEGVGVLLFDAVAREAGAMGLSQLQWQTPEWNTRAAEFYSALGGRAQQKLRFSLILEPTPTT
ncbi:GNAT family N-acetyltransferase [Herbiconiux liangxiaofengii]|uniref:GNAT family N-acetyltransferase n=1 Tax=Herbiconiux liangxiaofengii TaxID=3342795 RepID=UPI0035B90D91